MKRRLAAMAAAIGLLHVAGFALLALLAGTRHPSTGAATIGLGTGLLAYSLGLRHAFDADHLAAIDNITRRLTTVGKRPVGVGFCFSLGHSTVVFALVLVLSLGVRSLGSELRDDSSALHHVTTLAGTTVSATTLLVLAGVNLVAMKRRRSAHGPLTRLLSPLTRLVDASWKAYPLGILFGLGFDTATEIGLLVLAGGTVASGVPLWGLLALPLLFAAGMSLLDTVDGVAMRAAYAWAATSERASRRYDLTLTGASAAVAATVAAVELAQLLGDELHLTSAPWRLAGAVDLSSVGYMLAAASAAWAVAVLAGRRLGRARAAARAEAIG